MKKSDIALQPPCVSALWLSAKAGNEALGGGSEDEGAGTEGMGTEGAGAEGAGTATTGAVAGDGELREKLTNNLLGPRDTES